MSTKDSANEQFDYLEIDDNRLMVELVGAQNEHIERIEKRLNVVIRIRGNQLHFEGANSAVSAAQDIIEKMYLRLSNGQNVTMEDINAALRMTDGCNADCDDSSLGDESTPDNPESPAKKEIKKEMTQDEDLSLKTRKRHITPRSANQAEYIRAMNENGLVFGLGPAGTGKTYLAVAKAVALMVEGKIDRIILSRPAVEAGEHLGFLPGDMRDKIDPYLRPLYDALYEMLPADQVDKKLESGEIEVAPLAFMRGRTLSNAAVILDEAQNTTAMQMKMFLTRMGQNSMMVINGDMSQTDLPGNTRSGLADALEILEQLDGVGVVQFSDRDVVRHGLVARIVRAYEERNKRERGEI